MNAARLPRALTEELRRRALAAPDEEVCGLIARDSGGGFRCYPIPNRAGDRRRAFALDPKAQIDALRTMREHGEELAAIYHSHPDGPAWPSPADIEQHQYPAALYLIISLRSAGNAELRGFYIRDGRVEAAELSSE